MRTRALTVLMLAVVIAAAGFAVVSARRLGTQSPPRGRIALDLAVRVTQLMEQDFRSLTAPGGGQVSCSSRPFGVRPEGLTDAADATTIYAWVTCRANGVRTLVSPVALRLDRPPSVRMPEPGDDRERSIRRIFPADVRDALWATADSDLAAVKP